MTNWKNRIFTNLKNNITATFYTSRNIEKIETPSVYLEIIDNVSQGNTFTMEEENAQKLSVQIETYTSGDSALSDNYKLQDTIISLMLKMGFYKIMGSSIISNSNDTKITRLISRYSRVIGSGDTIEKI